MDERILFERVHEALDIEPRSGAYERLLVALAKSPARSRGPALGLRFAAALAVVALAAAIVAAFLATHHTTNQSVPAVTGLSIQAYEKLQADDYAAAAATWSQPCDTTTHTGCRGDASRAVVALQQWLDDLDRSQPPARFSVIDAQLRAHLTAAISGLDALISASQAKDSDAMNRAYVLADAGRTWADTTMQALSSSQQVTAGDYINSVRAQSNALTGCASCQALAGPNQVACSGGQAAICQDLLDGASGQVALFQSSLVAFAAPDSLSAKDGRLQQDLAQADTALIAMSSALSLGDQAGFNARQVTLERALAAVNQDAATILNG